VEGSVKEIIIALQMHFVLFVVWVFVLVRVNVGVSVTLMTNLLFGVITTIVLLVTKLLTPVNHLVVLLVLSMTNVFPPVTDVPGLSDVPVLVE